MVRARRLAGRLRVAISAAVLLVGSGALGSAQSAAGSIDGIVVDQSGGVLPGVSITLTQSAIAYERRVVTDERGFFHAPLLPVGAYELTAARAGLDTRTLSGITVTVGHAVTVRVLLPVGRLAETVTVSTVIGTSATAAGAVVDETAVQNLPVNGRNFIDFVLLTPGVTRDVRLGDVSAAGQRGTLNSLVVDGADNNNTFAGQTLGRTGSGRAPYQFSLEAVKEFQVSSNAFPAEYGRAGGAVINVITRSGTNDMRGTLFEFYRDKALNAANAIKC
jgi:hypothetical protein